MPDAPEAKKPRRFSDFAEHGGPLEGKKIRIDDVLNVEILLVAFKMKASKYQQSSAPECVTIQFEYPDKPLRRVQIPLVTPVFRVPRLSQG